MIIFIVAEYPTIHLKPIQWLNDSNAYGLTLYSYTINNNYYNLYILDKNNVL